MDSMIIFLNTISKSFVDFSISMLIQSSLLIAILLVLGFFLRKKVRVIFLYGIWMLVLVKLVLPTTLSSPTGLGHLLGDNVPSIITEKASSISKQIASILQSTKPASKTIPYGIIITDLSSAGTLPEAATDTFAQFPTAASEATVSLSWQSFAFIGWLTVSAAMASLLIQRMFFVRSLLAQSKNPNDSMFEVFERCRKQMGVNRPVSLRLSPVAASPSVCGIFRPTILIPQNLLRKLKADDLRAVFLHELAHIKRGDLWISLVQTILQIAYFYNPLLWVANVTIRKVREEAVDETVLVAMGEQAEDYPETLLNISRMTFGRPALSLRLIGIIESKKALERRIMNMLDKPVPKSSKLGHLGLIAIVVIGSVILPMGYNPTEQTALAASVKDGRIVDKVDYPFVNDPEVIGGWKSVDFVREIKQFNPIEKSWKGDLYLNHFIFEEGGKIAGDILTWTKGLVFSDDTASKYIIKEINGSTYMFFEWKSGDYTIRYRKPSYYVLKKVLAESLKYEPMFGKKADIPPTSHINEEGHIVDKTDWPFVNDPEVIGGWKSVDFVDEMEEFKADEKDWKGDLFLNHLIFEEGGKIAGNLLTWTKGLVLSDDTASKYHIKEIDGSAYMFYEWKSGDYTIRYRKPSYYVLKKVFAESLKYEPMFGKKADIPPTSYINEKGHIVDKTDYPFINDPQIIGTWKSVDFVDEMKEFKAGEQQRKGRERDLFLNEMIFEDNGKLTCKNDKVPNGYSRTWTKGLVIDAGKTKTASKYTIKEIDGSTYIFYEWKSGDYTFRHRKPSYYVLKKVP